MPQRPSRPFLVALLAVILFPGHLYSAAESRGAIPSCDESEAKVIVQPVIRLDHWPSVDTRGGDLSLNGTFQLVPAPPAPDMLCTWQASSPSGHRAELSLALDPFGKAQFRIRTLLPDGWPMAEGTVRATQPIYGYWQVRNPSEVRNIVFRKNDRSAHAFHPGSVILAERPDSIDATAAKKELLDPPKKLAADIRAGRLDIDLEVFNLDEASRRYLVGVCNDTIRSPKARVRKSTVIVLGSAGGPAGEALPLLIAALRDPDGEVAGYAAEAIKDNGSDMVRQAAPALTTALSHTHPLVRVNAVQAIALLDPAPQAAVPALVKAAADGDMYVREGALRALGAAGPPNTQTEKALVAALDDGSTNVRVAAARALIRVGRARDKVAGMTDALQKSGDVNDRARAAELSGLLGPAAFPSLIRSVADPSLHVREHAYRSLLAIRTPEAANAAEQYDHTELSPRFWERLAKLAGASGPDRAGLAPMLAHLRKGFLFWSPPGCSATARGAFVLHRSPDLREQVIDLSEAGTVYKATEYDIGQKPPVDVTFLEQRDGVVRLRTDQGTEGWTRRDSFACWGHLVAESDGRIRTRLHPLPLILERERQVRFVLIDSKPHLSFSSMDRQGQMFTGLAFELDPKTLAIVDVNLYDDRSAGPPRPGASPKGFPRNLFGSGGCYGCFEVNGSTFLY